MASLRCASLGISYEFLDLLQFRKLSCKPDFTKIRSQAPKLCLKVLGAQSLRSKTAGHCSVAVARAAEISETSMSVSCEKDDEEVELEHRNEFLEAFFDRRGEPFEDQGLDTSCVRGIIAAGSVKSRDSVLVGPGCSTVVPELRKQLVNVMVAHWSLEVLANLKEMDDEVRCWQGDLQQLPASTAPFNAVFLGYSLAVCYSPVKLLEAAASRCSPSAKVVISYSQGRDGLTRHRQKYPHILLRDLPEEKDLQSLISTLPLELRSFTNDPNSYLATLEVTSSKKIAMADGDFGVEFPLYATGKVVYGFGRGSKQMGIPTANLNPEDLPQELLALPKGVYYGWAQVRAPGLDTRSHMMVMNIGNRPTFADSGAVTLEVHILHDYESVDFYGEEAAIVVLGFIRLEMKFKSLDELVGRILEDIAMAKNILSSDEVLHSYQSDPFFAS
ncbi:unnamed protein product [Sphagnum compactum]